MEGGKGHSLDNLRGNDFARPTPGREGVKNNDIVVLDGRVEFGLAVSC